MNSGWILALLVLLMGCSAAKPVQDDGSSLEFPVVIYDDKFEIVKYPLSLADFLIQVPGVQVSGNKVIIRGQHPPLFVIDDVLIGHDYASAERAVSVFDIQSVEVLKEVTRIVRYGSQGVNGVIIIRTLGSDFRENKDSVTMELL